MKNPAISLGSVRVRFALGALLVGALVAAAPGNSATAQQTGQGQYLTEASARLGKLIGQANKDGYEFTDNNFSIGGGWLKQSKENWVPLYTLTLQGGKKYRFIAAGDADAKDVDLEIQNLNGKKVAFDDTTNAEAVVNYTPQTTGKYLVRVRLYDSKDSLPCLCLAVVMSEK